MAMENLPLVLVTGATGYIATQIIQDLYDTGKYSVRGTTRNLQSEKSKMIKKLFPQIELVACTLTADDGWEHAFEGVSFVLHVASPYLSFFGGNIEHFLKPAKEGTRRVLEGANKERGIKRVIVTSSIAAIAYGHEDKFLNKRTLGPNDWTNLDSPNLSPYQRSKTVAEKLVWEFKKTKEPRFDICTINPAMVVGPVLCKNSLKTTSSRSVKQWLLGGTVYRVRVPVVDVRDVSICHVHALDMSRDVDGKRYILSCDTVWLVELTQALHREFSSKGYKPVTQDTGGGLEWDVDGSLAEKELLCCKYRSWDKGICAHAKSLIKLGEIENKEIDDKKALSYILHLFWPVLVALVLGLFYYILSK